MDDSTVAWKLREQLRRFVGIVFPHEDKTGKRFLADMFFGMQAAKSVVLCRIARKLREDILLKKTEERLSRHLLADGLEKRVHDAVLAQGAAYIHEDAIADGVSELFTRCGRWRGLDGPDRDAEPAGRTFQLELGL